MDNFHDDVTDPVLEGFVEHADGDLTVFEEIDGVLEGLGVEWQTLSELFVVEGNLVEVWVELLLLF
jgi:hypothetical protein